MFPNDVIQLQVDEVVTKSQESGRKMNKTFTATIEDGSGRTEYLVAKTSPTLQLFGCGGVGVDEVVRGKRLEVISDGAIWIGDWIRRLCGLDVYQILCWYHLCKRDSRHARHAEKKKRKKEKPPKYPK
jgi:hypothetical protein